MRRIAAAVVLLTLLPCTVQPQKAAPPKPENGAAPATPVVIDWLMQSDYGEDRRLTPQTSPKLLGQSAKVTSEGDGIAVQWGGQRFVVPAAGRVVDVTPRQKLAVFPDAAGRLHWFSAAALACTVDDLPLLFLDANANGKFCEENVDMVALGPRGAYAWPHTRVMPLVGYSYTFRHTGKEIAWTRTPLATQGQALELHNALNRTRMQFGLLPTISDPAADAGCHAHCQYMQTNDEMKHSQDRAKPGYTKEGDAAARTSILTRKNTPEAAVAGWFGQPLHGRDIRSSWLGKAGFGFHEGNGAIRTSGLVTPEQKLPGPVVFPPNDCRDVPTGWASGESPEPRLDPSRAPGFPITLCWPWGVPLKVTALAATLESRDGDQWKPVKVQASFPGQDYPKHMAGFDYVYILPVDTLQPNTTYRLKVTLTSSGGEEATRETCFVTGTRSDARQWRPDQQR
ncbi:MAG: hypothetical protein HS108_15205 [Planctomycetes bacterium]|jgi:hypothetical protein|nr:hypothetical protein [Planctomycetota bacterium]MCL4730338.1 hypothetical protein [Planctomycetota bacterium]